MMICTYGEVYVVVSEIKHSIKHIHQYQLVFYGNKLKLHTYTLSIHIKCSDIRLVFLAKDYARILRRDDILINQDKFKKLRWHHLKSLSKVKVPSNVIDAAMRRLKAISK